MGNIELLKELEVFLQNIHDKKRDSITLEEYIDKFYLNHFFKSKRSSTIRGELSRIRIITNSKLAKMMFHQINLDDINDFFCDIQKNNVITFATCNRYRARLSAIFNHAISNNIIDTNLIKKVKVFKEVPRSTVLTDEEIHLLLQASKSSKNHNLYLIVMIALNTGMRKGEILKLSRSNISDNFIILKDRETKSGYGRKIPINDTLYEHLFNHIKKLPAEEDRLFGVQDVKRSFGNVRRSIGLNNLRFHDLRRTCATHLKDNGANIFDIKEILGHRDITMTQRYLHSGNSVLIKTVNKISFD